MADKDKKIAIYICTGCGIGDALDIESLTKVASKECKAALCRSHAFLCGDEGLALIRKDIADDGITGVVLAACSQRAKQEELSLQGVVVERASLREGVAWVLPPKDEDTQHLAEDYLRMYSEKARRSQLPEPYAEGEFFQDILVVGGGVAGLTAALEAARAGASVTLMEKEQTLGGFAAGLHRSIPSAPPYQELADPGVDALVAQVKGHPGIAVFTGAEIVKITGGPCKFEVQARSGSTELALKIGAIILATGFAPYDAGKLAHLGHGLSPDVVTGVDLERMAKEGKLVRPSDGRPLRSVLFVQCAGSRDPEHLPYCSAVCCNTTLKQALYLKQANPETQALVLHRDIRSPGQGEELYRQVQRSGAVFIRGEVREVSKHDGTLRVLLHDALLDEEVALQDLDLVVLATGQVPRTRMEEETIEPLEGDALDKPYNLKLEYRLGAELPNLRYGYPDSHFICFPYETRRTGIYAAGSVRRAMDMAAAKRDATGAALKALQCVAMTTRGEAVHPRAGDLSYPEFFMQRCTQCKRCTEECPFGAINEDEKANPLPNLTRCRRCGVCMGACPERIVSFKNYAVDMFNAMIKCIEVPEEEEEKLCVLAFVCENDALPVLDTLAQKRVPQNPYIRFLSLRCMGGMNLIWVAEALSKGIDGILFLGCQHGDDYQCHFIKGSELCATRLTKVQETLDRLVLEADRVRFEQISMNDMEKVPTIIEEFMGTLERVGPNPYKGF